MVSSRAVCACLRVAGSPCDMSLQFAAYFSFFCSAQLVLFACENICSFPLVRIYYGEMEVQSKWNPFEFEELVCEM